MPYDEQIDARIRAVVSSWPHTEAKKMFGGVCHMLNGNMFCGVYKEFLILRLGEARAQTAMQQPFVKAFDITGRPMKGWVMVAYEGFGDDEALVGWLEQAKRFALTLPPKK